MFMSTHLVGFGADTGVVLTDIGKPAGVTPIFQAGFSSSASTYDVNTASFSLTGSPTYNSTGGALNGGYVSGLVRGSIYYSASNIFLGDASSANWITMFAWIKTSDATATANATFTRNVVFGDDTGSCSAQFGVGTGKIEVGLNGTATRGSTTVSDGNWHLLCWQQASQSTWNGWVDKVKEISAASNSGASTSNLNRIGSGFSAGNTQSIGTIDGVQIYQGQLSDSQVQEVYTAAGF